MIKTFPLACFFPLAVLALSAGAVAVVEPGDKPTSALAPAPAPPKEYFDPTSACAGSGGTYLGNRQCRLANGKTIKVWSSIDPPADAIAAGTPRAWALATTAIVFEGNGARHDALGGFEKTPDNQAGEARQLSDWWGVENRADLLKQLDRLQFEGHRKDLEDLGRRVDAMNDVELALIRVGMVLNEQGQNSLEIVQRYHRALGDKGILAWDLVRYIALCRWGYLAGYLSEEEAWARIMPAAARLQMTFTSWRDMEEDYLIGREFWSLQQTRINGARFRQIYERLLIAPGSPWIMNRWDLDLHTAAPLPIVADRPGH